MASILDLDAEVCGEYLAQVPERIAGLLAPTTIVDLGSGTGVGSVALARRFPDARVIALDASADMIERTMARAADAGVADRIHGLVADLDTALPAGIGPVDVAWSSSTMHHFADPKALLRSTFDALRAGGVLAVMEITEMPAFLGTETSEGLLEQRIQPSETDGGWHGRLDWAEAIGGAGFDIVDVLDIVSAGSGSSRTADYAALWMSHLAARDVESLSATDRDALNALVAGDGPTALRHRQDLAVRGRRTAWIAERPSDR